MSSYEVDDRCFVLGLNEAFREVKQAYELAVLLPAAERVAAALGVAEADVPVEGYYYQSEALSRYFRLIRALQQQPATAMPGADCAQALQTLRAYFSSPALGRPVSGMDNLLPQTSSPLNEALQTILPQDWNIDRICQAAMAQVDEDDVNLLALAAMTGDALLICATRETMALDMCVATCAIETPTYRWAVSAALAERANRFIDRLQRDTGIVLPAADASSAEYYFHQQQNAGLSGRCIAIGQIPGNGYYHWYIGYDLGGCQVKDFWSDSLWTTEQMMALPFEQQPVSGSRVGAVPEPLAIFTAHGESASGWFKRLWRRLGG